MEKDKNRDDKNGDDDTLNVSIMMFITSKFFFPDKDSNLWFEFT